MDTRSLLSLQLWRLRTSGHENVGNEKFVCVGGEVGGGDVCLSSLQLRPQDAGHRLPALELPAVYQAGFHS